MAWFRSLEELNTLLSSPQVSLEILPGGLDDWITSEVVEGYKPPSQDFPFLYTDGNLGIPIKALYKIYLTAVDLFKSSRSVPELCRISTCAILLANPAHQTALNARRRLVLSSFLHAEKELKLVEVFFRGSSDCARQSILWDYRRWLLKRLYVIHLSFHQFSGSRQWTTAADLQTLPDIPPDTMIKELSIIRRACESHPRNYHAWTHWHFVIDIVNARLSTDLASPSAYVAILTEERDLLINWVDRHVSDHSSMHRLCNLSQLLVDLRFRYPTHLEDDEGTSRVTHATSLITSYPSHESLWMYLREAVTLLSTDGRKEVIDQIQSSSISESPFARRFVNWFGSQGLQEYHQHKVL